MVRGALVCGKKKGKVTSKKMRGVEDRERNKK